MCRRRWRGPAPVGMSWPASGRSPIDCSRSSVDCLWKKERMPIRGLVATLRFTICFGGLGFLRGIYRGMELLKEDSLKWTVSISISWSRKFLRDAQRFSRRNGEFAHKNLITSSEST